MTALSEASSPATPPNSPGQTEQFTPELFQQLLAQAAKNAREERVNEFRARPDSKSIIDWVLSQYEAAKSARARTRRQWLLNYAFYRGQQNLEIAPAHVPNSLLNGRITKADNRNHRAVNRIRPMVRTELAKMTSQKPSAVVIPASSEDQDLFAAQAGEQVWECLYDRLNVAYHFSRAAFWTSVAGNGFLKVSWDSGAYDQMSEIQGDICISAPTPFHIFVADIMEPDLQQQPWVIHNYSKPVEWVKMRYEAELAHINVTPDVTSENNSVESEMLRESGNNSTKPDSVAIYEMWLKPGAHKAFPHGGMITIINNQVVEVFTEGIPYRHGNYPFIKFDHIPTDTFYCDSVITDIMDLQRQYNSIRTKIAVTIRKMASMQLMAQEGSVNSARWNNDVGTIVYYRPGMPAPTPIPMAELPSYLFNELDRILMDIEDISGQHQVSKGQTPPGVTAATAISFLQEQDDSYLSPTYDSIERGFQELARQAINLAVQYWDTPRLIKVAGKDAAFDTKLLSGADLQRGTDIRIEGGSALPQSPAARRAFIMDLMGQGFIPPEEGLKFLEMGGVQKIVDTMEQDARAAKRENLKLAAITDEDIQEFRMAWQQAQAQNAEATVDMETGAPLEPPTIVPVNSWDNHEVHIQIHNQYRKSQAFELLSPAVKAEFEAHVQMHHQAMLQEVMQSMMEQLPSDGTDMNDGGFDPATMGQDPEVPPDQLGPTMAGGQEAIPGLENLGGLNA